MTDRDALIARLRAIAARFDMTSTERYEQDSEAFYAQTGYMAPGKDVPMAMGGQDETERRAAHESWIAGRNRSQQQAIQEAADALAALPPPADMNTAAEHYRQGWQAGHAAADPLPPRPTGSEPINRVDLVRYGVATPGSPTLLTPMADGYWTPWHIAAQTPADPPALVALVREYQDVNNEWHALPDEHDNEELVERVGNRLGQLHERLLDYPLPAAPPVTDTAQGCPICGGPRPCDRCTTRNVVDVDALKARLENERLRAAAEIVKLIADDSWAVTFQSLGQYRSALLKVWRDSAPAAPPQEDRCASPNPVARRRHQG